MDPEKRIVGWINRQRSSYTGAKPDVGRRGFQNNRGQIKSLLKLHVLFYNIHGSSLWSSSFSSSLAALSSTSFVLSIILNMSFDLSPNWSTSSFTNHPSHLSPPCLHPLLYLSCALSVSLYGWPQVIKTPTLPLYL